MSLFDFPRINIKGTIQLNPGTANNDDYAAQATFPADAGPLAGKPLALIDSKRVEARTYGMSDEDFIAWVQKAHTFDGVTSQVIPAEWNYYGAMDSKTLGAKVIGVQTGASEVHSQRVQDVPFTEIIGADLTFNGSITDVNSEGSPPATQFFIEQLELKQGGNTLISGKPSKGASQWLNFYRNVNLTADSGAGAYVYHILEKSDGNKIQIPLFDSPDVVGVIFRYYLFHSEAGTNVNAEIEALYEEGKNNPASLEMIATFAPLYSSEQILTTPTGRLMVSNTPNIPTPKGFSNNGPKGTVALAPGVLQQKGTLVSADFSGTFPDYFHDDANPKYDFGPVSLVVSDGSESAEVGTVDYANTDGGDQRGWVFDFDISANEDAQRILRSTEARFKLDHASYGTVLGETDYYFVSNQVGIYTEQLGSGSEFLNQGTTEPATVTVYHRGRELSEEACPPITLWQYRSIPLQAPGDAQALTTNLKPGQPIAVDTGQPGNFLYTFTIDDANKPPPSYSTFMNPPFVTNAPSISLRILPNDEDFSEYYDDPDADEPVGNPSLTFDVVFSKVLRTYYLLYPVMNKKGFELNSETAVTENACAILQATEQSMWMSTHYMPRTRDLSASRRQLLRAWCRKVLQG